MSDLLAKLIEKFGKSTIPFAIGLGFSVAFLSHLYSEPGTQVNILWGLTSYTKVKDKIPKVLDKLENINVELSDIRTQGIAVLQKSVSDLKIQSDNISTLLKQDKVEITNGNKSNTLIDKPATNRINHTFERISYIANKSHKPITLSPPAVITLSNTEVSYYQEVCDAYQSSEYTLEELKDLYPGMSENAACNWKITGLTINGWLDFQQYLDNIATLIERLSDSNNNLSQPKTRESTN